MESEKQESLTADLVKKNWEVVQALLTRTSDHKWKVEAGGAAAWWAVIVLCVSQGKAVPVTLLLMFIAFIFLYSVSLKRREEQLAKLSKKIEMALTSFARGDFLSPLESELEVSATLPRQTDKESEIVFTWSRKRFWLPYLFFFVITPLIPWLYPIGTKQVPTQSRPTVPGGLPAPESSRSLAPSGLLPEVAASPISSNKPNAVK